jgi:hypothetical protein
LDFSILKLGTQGIIETPLKIKFLMGVIAFAIFDQRSSSGPQQLLESAIWKNADLVLDPKNFAFYCPHYFQILSGVSFIILFDPRSSHPGVLMG